MRTESAGVDCVHAAQQTSMSPDEPTTLQNAQTLVDRDTADEACGSGEEKGVATLGAIIGDVPAFPAIALRVLQQSEGDDWDVAELAAEIRRDHALTARFLRGANSAHYGARRTIGSVNQALTMLGGKKVRTTLLAASVEGLLQADQSNFEEGVLWQHALSVACVSEHFATTAESCDPEDAFMSGLLHDIGRSVLDSRYPAQYREVIRLAAASGAAFCTAEQQMFGFDHAEVGFLVADAWGLPARLLGTIRWHHHPDAAPSDSQLCATVSVANDWCVKHGIGPEVQSDLELGERAGAQILGWDASRIDELTDDLMAVVERLLAA